MKLIGLAICLSMLAAEPSAKMLIRKTQGPLAEADVDAGWDLGLGLDLDTDVGVNFGIDAIRHPDPYW